MLTERAADLKPWGDPGFHITADGALVIDVRHLTEQVKVTVAKDGQRLLRQYLPDQRVRLHIEFERYHARLAAAVADRNAEHPGSGDAHVQALICHTTPGLELLPQAAIRWLSARTTCPSQLEQLSSADGLPRRPSLSVYTTRGYRGAAPTVLRALGLSSGASVARFLMVACTAADARDLFHEVQAGRHISQDSVVVAGGMPRKEDDADYADLLHSAGLTVHPAVYALPPRHTEDSPLVCVCAPGEVVTIGTLYQVTEDPYPHSRINPATVVKGQS